MKITYNEYPQLQPIFDDILEYEYDRSYDQHRKNAGFWRRSIIEIDNELLKEYKLEDHQELLGFWETDQYLWDDIWGIEESPSELVRVKTVELISTSWESIEEEPYVHTNIENEAEKAASTP